MERSGKGYGLILIIAGKIQNGFHYNSNSYPMQTNNINYNKIARLYLLDKTLQFQNHFQNILFYSCKYIYFSL